MFQGNCALQGNGNDSGEEAPGAAPELFEDDSSTDLCVLCREMVMTAKKEDQVQPLSCLRMTATQICLCFAGK